MEKVYHKPTNTVHDLTDELKQEIKSKNNVDEYAKVLVLPEHFSDKHLQAIVDGKMKEENSVFLKTENEKRKELLDISIQRLGIVFNLGDKNCNTCDGHGCIDTGNEWGCILEHCPDCYPPRVHLNQQNHITLFPAKQSLEEAAKEFSEDGNSPTAAGNKRACQEQGFKAGAEWAKKNNY